MKISLLIGIILFYMPISGFATGSYPQDVVTFIETCDHFRGEISGEPEVDNARNLHEELDKYCKGTDKQLEALKNKYRNNQAIINKLNDYEESIEPDSPDSRTETATVSYKFLDYPIKDINVKKYSSKKYTANFAGRYFINTMGCGGGAICGNIIEARTGKVIVGFPNAYLIEDDDGNNFFNVEYRLDSHLLVISGIAADPEIDANSQPLLTNYRIRYYNFINAKLVLLGIDNK